jgi:Sec-independent protein translocase protein TatA
MSDLRIEKDINTGKLTVTKCETWFICKPDLVHKFVNQINTLIDQNAIPERELSDAQNTLKRCLSIMPVGYTPTHTVENLPEMIGDLAKALAEETTEREKLERELAEAQKENKKLIADMILHERMSSQFQDERDTLAKAASKLNHYIKAARAGDSPCVHDFIIASIDDAIVKMDAALAAVKGGGK